MFKEKRIDLTQGEIWKTLILFAIPILVGGFFQQLYTVADAVIVGRFVGSNGLAAIDSIGSLLVLPVNFFIGLSTGATILISQLFGAKNYKNLSKALHTAIFYAIIGGLALSIVGVIFAKTFVEWMSVPEEIINMSVSYVRILYSGFMISMLFNIGSGILRAIGDSRSPLFALVVACLVNIGLDIVFIGYIGMGVKGAAIATVISQTIACLIVIGKLRGLDSDFALRFKNLSSDLHMAKAIVKIGLPVGFQGAVYPFANILIASQINKLGTNTIAAWAILGKVDIAIWIFVDSLAAATATFIAQNYGAGKKDRVNRAVRTSLSIILTINILLSILVYFKAADLGLLIIPTTSPEVLAIIRIMASMMGPFYSSYVFGEVFSCALRGIGETFVPMAITLICTCLIRVIWIFLVVPLSRNLETIISIYPISWSLTSIIMSIYYFYYRKKHKHKFSIENESIKSGATI